MLSPNNITTKTPAPIAARLSSTLRSSKRRTGRVSSDTTISDSVSIIAPRSARQRHRQRELAQLHFVPVLQDRLLLAASVHARAVRAAEVLDEEARAVEANRRMGARHGGLGDHDVGTAASPDHHPVPIDRHLQTLVEAAQNANRSARRHRPGRLVYAALFATHRRSTK